MENSGQRLTKKLLKIRPSTRHLELFRGLNQKFKGARNKGQAVDFNWLWTKANKVQSELTGNPNATVRSHVVVQFIKKYRIRMRAKQRSKKVAKAEMVPLMKKWHATTRERLVRSGLSDRYDEKWGRFKPSERLNVDQSPLPFVLSGDKTYESFDDVDDQRNKKVWIAQPSCGLEKRQCTLQICYRPEGKSPRVAIIFRGKGRVTTEEREAWCKDVDVFFQARAWADTEFSVDWVKTTLSPIVKDLDRFVLFCDNLSAQVKLKCSPISFGFLVIYIRVFYELIFKFSKNCVTTISRLSILDCIYE